MADFDEKTGAAEGVSGSPPTSVDPKTSSPSSSSSGGGSSPPTSSPPSSSQILSSSESFPTPPSPPPSSAGPSPPSPSSPEAPQPSSFKPEEQEKKDLSPHLPPEASPVSSSISPPEKEIPEEPKGNKPPLPSGVSVEKQKSLIWKVLPYAIGALVFFGVIFIVWKFVAPLIPAGIRPGGVTLTYWGLWEEESALASLIADYEKDHRGVKIEYKKQSPREYRERLQVAIAQGEGPDIFRFHNTWVPMLKADLSSLPASVFSSDGFEKTFYPVAVRDLKIGNSFYGIPLEIDGLALLYNKEIFEAAGISPPTTWEDLQRSAYLLTVRDSTQKIQTAGVALGTTNNVDNWSDILALMFLQNGVDLKAPQGNLAEDTLIFYTSFTQGENRVWDETLPPSTLAFTQGKVAMIFAPSWQILTIKEKNPSLEFKVLPVPQLPGISINWASYWVEGVSAKSPHQAEAWEFLKYFSQKETLAKFYTEVSKTRLFGEPYSRQDLASSLATEPYVGPYIKQAPQAQSFYLSSLTYDNGINDKTIKYFEDAVNAVNQGVSPESALETTAKGIAQIFSNYDIAVPVIEIEGED